MRTPVRPAHQTMVSVSLVIEDPETGQRSETDVELNARQADALRALLDALEDDGALMPATSEA